MLGIALVGLLTASIAAWFVREVRQSEDEALEPVEVRLARLEAKLDQLLAATEAATTRSCDVWPRADTSRCRVRSAAAPSPRCNDIGCSARILSNYRARSRRAARPNDPGRAAEHRQATISGRSNSPPTSARNTW